MNSAVALTEQYKSRLPMGILSAALLPDGKRLAAACMDGVYLTSIDQSIEARRLYTHDNYVSSVRVLSHSLIVSAGYDGRLTWYDLESKKTVRSVKLHDFWSWDMAVSPDGTRLASVTGQYLAGGYKYEPKPEREPSLKILDALSGEVQHVLPHVPSVQAVAFSPDSQHVAAGNLMGEIRVFRVDDGALVANWTTPSFTSWGVIKSHCYLGGVFALQFTPSGRELLLAGMGPMKDPMAGNGKQLWQKWDWQAVTPELLDETHDGESGEGLMEALALHPEGDCFAMAGRLRGGDWNAAIFELESGTRLANLKTGCRITQAIFSSDGTQLILVGAQGQPKKAEDGKFPDFGRIDVFRFAAGLKKSQSS